MLVVRFLFAQAEEVKMLIISSIKCCYFVLCRTSAVQGQRVGLWMESKEISNIFIYFCVQDEL